MRFAERASTLWQARSARERRLIIVMLLVLFPMLFWYGLAMPLQAAAGASAAHHARAAETAAMVDVAASLERPSSVTMQQVLASIAAAGLTLDGHSPNPEELQVSVRVSDPAALFGWILTLQEDLGLAVANLTVEPDGDGMLRVEAILTGVEA
jgi:general secretion pathway protein M